MKNCEIFDINDSDISARIIAENTLAFAFLTRTPIVTGHTLICPKRPVSKSEMLTVKELAHIMQLKDVVCDQLKRILAAEGFNFAWNEGSTAGQTVSHFHLHVVPRRDGDTGITQYEPRVFLYRPGVRPTSPEKELADIASLLRV